MIRSLRLRLRANDDGLLTIDDILPRPAQRFTSVALCQHASLSLTFSRLPPPFRYARPSAYSPSHKKRVRNSFERAPFHHFPTVSISTEIIFLNVIGRVHVLDRGGWN